MAKPKARLLIGALVAVAALLAGAAWLARSFHQAAEDTTDTSQYTAILHTLGYPTPTALDVPTLAHLPATIPAVATKVRFYYQPHMLQGGMRLQLRMALPTAELQAAAKSAQAAGKTTDAPVPLFRDDSNRDFGPLPQDFQAYVLDAKGAPGWNHGYSCGVAVSEQRSEVIYWVDD